MARKKDDLTFANINTKEDFINYILALKKDISKNPDYYQTVTLDDLLQGIAEFTKFGLEGHYKFCGLELDKTMQPWNLFARIIGCSTVFE